MKSPLIDAVAAIKAQIERSLITRIEEIEGRVPSDVEVCNRAACETQQDGRRSIYTWRGVPIVEVHPPLFGDQSPTWTIVELRPVSESEA